MNGHADLQHLAFLAESGRGLAHLKGLLCTPLIMPWGVLSAEGFSQVFESLRNCLEKEPGLAELLELNLVTAWLLRTESEPEWYADWVRTCIPRYFPSMKWRDMHSGRWDVVPVFLVKDRACVRYFVVGYLDPAGTGGRLVSWPEWADPLMDQTVKTAIYSAAAASGHICPTEAGCGFYCYPLTVPNRRVQFTQGSCGLPLALGFIKLVAGESASDGLAVTGVIHEDGTVRGAARVGEKIRHAAEKGFKVFLRPAACPVASGEPGLEVLPVSSLREAWMFSVLYTPGKAKELVLTAGMLEDPRVFVNNCCSVPQEWLLWACRNNRTRFVAEGLAASPDLFARFVEQFSCCLYRGDFVRAEALGQWVSEEMVGEAGKTAPLSVFKWYVLNLSLANHRGDVADARKWEKKACAMEKDASVPDIGALAEFCNHRFIAGCHNCYHFAPDLPQFVTRILDLLEEQYRSEQKVVRNAVNKTLGALYGSIAQNFGFCGPLYLAQTRKYVRLSGEAFGGGRVPEFREDWLRQLNYLMYAELDAGDMDAQTLQAYLEIGGWEDLWAKLPGLSPWRHAALARFLADSRETAVKREYADRTLRTETGALVQRHPWQLWLFNMGRVSRSLGDREQSINLYHKSLDLCMRPRLGPTVRVMALLPLSGLWEVGALPVAGQDGLERNIRASAQALNPVYFREFLEEPDFAASLEKIWKRPRSLFPFTYR